MVFGGSGVLARPSRRIVLVASELASLWSYSTDVVQKQLLCEVDSLIPRECHQTRTGKTVNSLSPNKTARQIIDQQNHQGSRRRL